MSVRKKDETWFFNGEIEPLSSDTHDVIVHSLNRWRDFKRGNTKRPVYFSVDNFSGTEAEWEGVPVIFSNMGHPNVPFRVDPVKALESCKGEIVGAFHSAAVETIGTPKFVGKIDFASETAETKHQKGELALSSGFYLEAGHDQLGRLQGKAIPDHILVFDANGRINQQDQAAMFLNGTTETPAQGPTFGVKDLFEKFKEFMKGYFVNGTGGTLLKNDSYDERNEQIVDQLRLLAGITDDGSHYLYIDALFPDSVVYKFDGELYKRDYSVDTQGNYTFGDQVPVQVGYIPVMNASIEEPRTDSGERMAEIDTTKTIGGLHATIAERDALIAAKTAEFETAKAQLTEFQKKQADLEAENLEKIWKEIKTKHLLPGQVKKTEDEAKLKEMFIKDKDSFYLNAVLSRPKKGDTEREGAEFYANGESQEDSELESLYNELKMSTGRRLAA